VKKKTPIVILLAIALLLVLALAGTASAYTPKVAPSVIDANCYANWPAPVGGSDTYDGYYSFHVEWSLTAGKPMFYRVQFCPSGTYPNWTSPYPWHKIKRAQLRAGALTTKRIYYEGLESDGWRVEIITNLGRRALLDYSPEWGA
jgi:hypothetical protein